MPSKLSGVTPIQAKYLASIKRLNTSDCSENTKFDYANHIAPSTNNATYPKHTDDIIPDLIAPSLIL